MTGLGGGGRDSVVRAKQRKNSDGRPLGVLGVDEDDTATGRVGVKTAGRSTSKYLRRAGFGQTRNHIGVGGGCGKRSWNGSFGCSCLVLFRLM